MDFSRLKIIEKQRGLPDRGWGRCVSGWRGFPEKDLVKHAPKYYQKGTQSTEWVVGAKKGTKRQKRYTYTKKVQKRYTLKSDILKRCHPTKGKKTVQMGTEIANRVPKWCRIPNRRNRSRSPKCHRHKRQSGTRDGWIVRIHHAILRHCSWFSDHVIHRLAEFSANSRRVFCWILKLSVITLEKVKMLSMWKEAKFAVSSYV